MAFRCPSPWPPPSASSPAFSSSHLFSSKAKLKVLFCMTHSFLFSGSFFPPVYYLSLLPLPSSYSSPTMDTLSLPVVIQLRPTSSITSSGECSLMTTYSISQPQPLQRQCFYILINFYIPSACIVGTNDDYCFLEWMDE